MNIIVQVLVGLIAIFGALFFLDTGIAMNRAKDAVTRANMNSPAIYVGFPLVAFALFIGDTAMNGFSWAHLIEFLLITFIVPMGSALGSMYLGRAMMLSQVRLDPRTVREDLRDVSPAAREEVAEERGGEPEKHHHHLEKYSEYEEYEEYDEEYDEESDGTPDAPSGDSVDKAADAPSAGTVATTSEEKRP